MSEAVERVARAIANVLSPHTGSPMLGLDPDFDDRPMTSEGCDDGELSQAELLTIARAAILALMEPDEGMQRAGMLSHEDDPIPVSSDRFGEPYLRSDAPRQVFRAMLTAALDGG